jgi:hypothetical protein
VLLSERRGKERAAALAAARAGKAAPKPKKSEAQKKVARDFYAQVRESGCRGLVHVGGKKLQGYSAENQHKFGRLLQHWRRWAPDMAVDMWQC